MTDKEKYELFAHHLEEALKAIYELKSECPADFNQYLSFHVISIERRLHELLGYCVDAAEA